MSPKAVLVGLPGAGKTTSGRHLARRLDVAFADSDEIVEARAGRSVRDIFDRDGEAAFRAAEADAVAAALTAFDGVLALGGGAILAEPTRAALSASGAPIVWLRADVETLARRVGRARSRPLLAGDPAARLAALAAEREALYRGVATVVIDTGGRSAREVAGAVESTLTELAWRA